MDPARSDREARYLARCSRKDDVKPEPGDRSAEASVQQLIDKQCEIVIEDHGVEVSASVSTIYPNDSSVVAGEADTFYVSFDVPASESTRAIDRTFTGEESEGGPFVPSESFSEVTSGDSRLTEPNRPNHRGFCQGYQGAYNSSSALLEEASGDEDSRNQESFYPSRVECGSTARRQMLIGDGFATATDRPSRHQVHRGRSGCGFGTNRVVWILAIVCATLCIGCLVVFVTHEVGSDDTGGTEDMSTTASSRDVPDTITTSTELPYAPDINPNNIGIKFELSLVGFICSLPDGKGHNLCISFEQGVCVLLKGKRKRAKHMIIVVVDTSKPPLVCRGKRYYREI